MKIRKFFSAVMCTAVMFVTVTMGFSVSEGSAASAATVYETPYYYNQLSDNGKDMFDKVKAAVLNCKDSVTINFGKLSEIDDLQMVQELLVFHDPTTFNLDDMTLTGYSKGKLTFELSYRYEKPEYKKMVQAYEEEVEEVLALLDDDMSTYTKIRLIHDYIVKNTEYDLDSDCCDNIYGTLVENKGKCDGYSKTFSYICAQLGIRTVTVIGNYKDNDTDYLHMWNKVYYNKNWYNIDVTWDDPVGNVIENLQYDYFMVSDEDLEDTHYEENFSFTVPAAEDSGKDYFDVNKKLAADYDEGKTILKNGVYTAASKGKTGVSLKCADKETFEKMKKYVLDKTKMSAVMSSANKKYNSDLITGVYIYGFNEEQYIISLRLFYKNTSLEDYFNDPDELDSASLKKLERVGIT